MDLKRIKDEYQVPRTCLIEFADEYFSGDAQKVLEELNVWLPEDTKKAFVKDIKKEFEDGNR